MSAPLPTSLDAVMHQLQTWGSESTRRIYQRQGAGEPLFGVTLGNLRGLARRLKTRHDLALELWATQNVDARILATMLMDPGRLAAEDLEAMLQSLTYFRLVDELVFNVVARSPHADALRERWTRAPGELSGRAGWNLLIHRVLSGQTADLDLDAILRQIEAEILHAPLRRQETMNRCLVEIAVHQPHLTRRCLDLGERLGRFDTRPVPKGCVSSYAPEWIAAVLRRKK